MNYNFWRTLFFFILIFSVEIVGKRGGGGGGFGRGSSSSRSSSAKSGGGGGWFGGGSKSSNTGSSHHSGSHRSGGGGFFGGGKSHGTGGFSHSSYRDKGIGSRSRSDTFKNMIVGAAAGYLTYQAGKAIIHSMSSPMTWNNRNYYWGQQYYPHGSSSSSRTMCRMPIEPGDPKFGNIFTPEGSHPKEIVWSCSYNEECCGYECCPGHGSGGGFGYGNRWNSGFRIGIGTIILILLLLCCFGIIIKTIYDKRKNQMENRNLPENKGEYQRANVNYTTNAQPPEAPPPYPATAEGSGYPPNIGFRYPPA